MSNAIGGTPQKIEGGREAIASAITGGIIGQAARGGFAVADDAVAALEEAAQPVEEVEETPAPADPVDAIVESLQAQAEDEREDVSAELETDSDEFEVPDFEAQAEAELLNEEIAASGTEFEAEEWDNDPEVNEARKRAIVAEKKAAYYENLTAQRERKKWEAEADQHFPMWRARGDITVNSRRGFLKAAKASHEAVKPFVKAAVKTREEQLEAERSAMKAEVKKEADEAWGKPTVAASSPGIDTGIDFDKEISEARRNQDLAKVLSLKRIQRESGGGDE